MVVVVVLVVVVWALVAVALVVVVMVLRVCPQDPLAFRWGFGVGHPLQLLELYGLVGSWGGLGAGLNGDRGRWVPPPRVGLAGGGGGFGGPDDRALGDGDVDEGLDGVVSDGRLCGCGSRWGEGGSGCGGWELLASVWVRVWVRAGSLLLLSYLFVVGGGGAAAASVLLFGFRFWFGVGFWVGVWFEVEEDLVLAVRGHQCWVGRVRGVLPGCLGCLCGGRRASGSLACSCGFGFGRGFVDEVGGEGGVGGGSGGRR